jgi:hypothetical protein
MTGTSTCTVPSPHEATARNSTYFGSRAATVTHPAPIRSRNRHKIAHSSPDLHGDLGTSTRRRRDSVDPRQ